MDDKWFKEVNAKLKEIEQANATRWSKPADLDPTTLILHPNITASKYWHWGNDERATVDWFDFAPQRFPKGYVSFIQTESAAQVRRYAERPYAHNNKAVDNTKTLVARIILLQLVSLLS